MARTWKVRRRASRTANARRGAAVTEVALILVPLLVLTLGLFDAGVAVFRYHIVAEAARHGARTAIVHGDRANPGAQWGPAQIDAVASSSGIPILTKIQPVLVGCDLSQTQITVDWPEGSNEFGKPVTVTISTEYVPVVAALTNYGPITLSASSTMTIAH